MSEKDSSPTTGSDPFDRWMDGLAQRIGRTVTYYIEHQDQLYRPYLTLYGLICLINLVGMFRLLTAYGDWPNVVGLFGVAEPIVAGIMTLITYRLLNAKRSQGINWIAVLIVVISVDLSVLYGLLGLYVIANSAFRREWADQLPTWLQRAITEVSNHGANP